MKITWFGLSWFGLKKSGGLKLNTEETSNA